ncbi:hypothetical protein HY251_03370, partial [bacterium]|nr:hypothetical protein [bacterium]
SFKEFTDAAQVLDYRESDVAIRTWGETAALTYRFDMSWEVTGERYQETGHDALLLVREGGKWVIAWRVMVSPSA